MTGIEPKLGSKVVNLTGEDRGLRRWREIFGEFFVSA
jgi:hypothetical protein